MIWQKTFTLKALNKGTENHMVGHCGIVFTEFGDDYLKATMPVDRRTTQPMGLLHGGASVVLAETIGSVAGHLCCSENQYVVGLEINANHLRSVKSGLVTATVKPIKLGRSIQVWDIRITDHEDKLACISRFMAKVMSTK